MDLQMLTVKKYNEKMVYLIEQMHKLEIALIERKNFFDENCEDYKKSSSYENLFSQLVYVKKKLLDLQNDIEAELELMTF